MTTSYELSVAQRRVLKDAITSVVSALDNQEVALRADAFDGMSSAVKDYVSSVLRDVALTRNKTKTPKRCLPSEIWTLIWQDLPLDDRIAVTHVCHSWRTLALSTPLVWSNIDIISDARVSQPVFSPYSCVHSSTLPSRRSPTNLLWMPDILDRGETTPITFLVALTGSRSDTRALLRTLGCVLAPHSARLTDIDFTFTPTIDTGSFSTFFYEFTGLPMLRSLRLHVVREDPPSPDGLLGAMVLRHISMPRLERLELGADVWFPDRRYVEFPALTQLTMAFPARAATLIDILEACPALQYLRLSLADIDGFGNTYAKDSSLTSRLSSLVSRLRAVRLTDVWDDMLALALSVFAQPSLHQFGIDINGIGCALVLRAMDVFAHVPAPVRLEFSTDGRRIQLAASARSGKNRALTFPQAAALDAVLAGVWRAVPPASLEGFSTTWTLWPRLYQRVSCAPLLRQLEIGISAESSALAPPPEIRNTALPALRTLVLRAATHTTVARAWVRDLVLSLQLGRPLEELLLVNVELADDGNASPDGRDWGRGVFERFRYTNESTSAPRSQRTS